MTPEETIEILEKQLQARDATIKGLEHRISMGAVAHAEDGFDMFEAIKQLRSALVRAEEWLMGWGSAEPYLTRIRQALEATKQYEVTND